MDKKVKLIIQIVIFLLMLLIISFVYQRLTTQDKQAVKQNINQSNDAQATKENQEEKENKEVNKMEVIKLTSQNFKEEVLDSDKPVLIDFYADWCGPCKMMSPIIEEIAQEVGDTAKVGKVNVDDNQDLAMEYGVMSIPTIIVVKKGEVTKTFVGVREKSEIMNSLK